MIVKKINIVKIKISPLLLYKSKYYTWRKMAYLQIVICWIDMG